MNIFFNCSSILGNQFLRVLWENLGLQLSDEEQRSLIQKYDVKQDGRVNYRLFCDIIDHPFDPDRVTADPSSQKVQVPEL